MGDHGPACTRQGRRWRPSAVDRPAAHARRGHRTGRRWPNRKCLAACWSPSACTGLAPQRSRTGTVISPPPPAMASTKPARKAARIRISDEVGGDFEHPRLVALRGYGGKGEPPWGPSRPRAAALPRKRWPVGLEIEPAGDATSAGAVFQAPVGIRSVVDKADPGIVGKAGRVVGADGGVEGCQTCRPSSAASGRKQRLADALGLKCRAPRRCRCRPSLRAGRARGRRFESRSPCPQSSATTQISASGPSM